ncbi:uncharacterized protein J8A68_003446 [[Candida] subhashii]|uniref:Uncharacterized protein n=1 Tax=[Candida] subhashii TaxID=561895 RepID=A0A8J5UYF8_9ASCO|nr:uncharacterized protein J8A68_003446 [[Candida] subhashii]KAG7663019.1 hypothetical protein J8A68_003446 [[Candida] subhashii]
MSSKFKTVSYQDENQYKNFKLNSIEIPATPAANAIKLFRKQQQQQQHQQVNKPLNLRRKISHRFKEEFDLSSSNNSSDKSSNFMDEENDATLIYEIINEYLAPINSASTTTTTSKSNKPTDEIKQIHENRIPNQIDQQQQENQSAKFASLHKGYHKYFGTHFLSSSSQPSILNSGVGGISGDENSSSGFKYQSLPIEEQGLVGIKPAKWRKVRQKIHGKLFHSSKRSIQQDNNNHVSHVHEIPESLADLFTDDDEIDNNITHLITPSPKKVRMSTEPDLESPSRKSHNMKKRKQKKKKRDKKNKQNEENEEMVSFKESPRRSLSRRMSVFVRKTPPNNYS